MKFHSETTPRIGAQFFVNPQDSTEDIIKHFDLMQEHGITLVRLFILWEHIEPEEGLWNFSNYDILYDLAAQRGIGILGTLTCEDPPNWFERKPFYHHYSNLNNPLLKTAAKKYINALVGRYSTHPAHYCWILMNEPEVYVNYEPSTLACFYVWLENKYHTIEELNQRWYTHFDSFNHIQVYPEDQKEYWQCFSSFIDWHQFLKDNLIEQLTWIKEEIRLIDSHSPLHVNPKGFFGNLAPVGQDYWKEGNLVDILGASIHPAWKFRWFERKDHGIAYAFCVDLIRSAAQGKPFWVTELQAGPTLMTGIQPYTPTPNEITAWLWDGFGAGASAIVYWMWHPRTFGQEAGEWGIVSADHKVSKRLLHSAQVAHTVDTNLALFENAKPLKPKVAIYYNHATEILALIEGSCDYRTPEAPIQALVGLYKALVLQGIAVDFISEEQILKGVHLDYEMLYFAYAYSLSTDVQYLLKDYVHNGGKIWADSPFAWKDTMGIIHRPSILEEVFGLSIVEYQGHSTDTVFQDKWLCHTEVLAHTATPLPDMQNTVWMNHFGQGTAYFVTTSASLGYFNTSLSPFKDFIVDCLSITNESPIKLKENAGHILTRIMKSNDNWIVILENWGEAAKLQIELTLLDVQTVSSLLTQEIYPLIDHTFTLSLSASETVVLLLTK